MIYVVGDSFSWGDEIADYILPNWPGYLDEVNTTTNKEWGLFRTNNISGYEEEHNKIRLANRWSTLLGQHLNMEVVNTGECGKSIHGMLTCLSHDLHKLSNVKMVVVQLTGLHRFQIPLTTEQDYGFIQKGYGQVNPLVFCNFKQPEVIEISKLRIQLNNDADFLYDYLNTILLMQQIIQSLTKTKLIILDSIFLTSFGEIANIIEIEKNTNERVKQVLEMTDFENQVKRFPSMWDVYLKNQATCKRTIAGHLCINTHRLFAQEIANLLNA